MFASRRLLPLLFLVSLAGCSNAPKSPPEASTNQGEELYRKGTELLEANPENAIGYLTRSLQLVPDSPPALYSRAVAYARTGHESAAVADARRLQEVEPKLGQRLQKEFVAARGREILQVVMDEHRGTAE